MLELLGRASSMKWYLSLSHELALIAKPPSNRAISSTYWRLILVQLSRPIYRMTTSYEHRDAMVWPSRSQDLLESETIDRLALNNTDKAPIKFLFPRTWLGIRYEAHRIAASGMVSGAKP